MLIWVGGLLAQVPLADMPRLVAPRSQRTCQTGFFQRQMIDIGGIDQLPSGRVCFKTPIDPICYTDGGRVLAGQNTGTCG